MFSLMQTEPPEENYVMDELVVDSVLGLCPLAVTAGLGLLIAGITFAAFILPMLIFIPFAYLALGAWRGKSSGNLWLKTFCLSGAALLSADTLGNTRTLLIGAALTIPFTALGLWLRRRGWLF